MLTVLASAVGPLVFAFSRESGYNSYSPAMYVSAAVMLAVGVIAWFTPTPAPREPSRR
jgi:hypothetical protein